MKYLVLGLLVSVVSLSVRGQALTKDQLSFLQKNSKAICQDDASQPTWDALSANLKDKRFILLGEFNHGSKEVFQLRTSLIKYLHEKLGINIILFESGIGELVTADIHKQTMTPGQMTNGLVGVWRTKEFVELMEYVKSENMSIAGFDVQRSGGSFHFLLKELADKKQIDSTLYVTLESRYGQLARQLPNSKAIYDSLKTKTLKLIDDYHALETMLTSKRSGDTSKEFLFSIVTIKNRIRFLSYMLSYVRDKNLNTRWAARDSAMADNVQWLMENIYKNERVIIVAHNFHISKFNEHETAMGEILNTSYGKEMYSLGVFAGTGSYHGNSGKEVEMVAPDSVDLDVKHIIQALKRKVSYLHIPKTKSTGSEWLDKKIIVNDTFIDLNNGNTMILSKSFDGLLLMDRVSPPKSD